ncbi:hypothetical protein B0H14DRAFT_2580016 [Mycena olivaceomarginata]|nr:hypothetical protein B0H14DRAFT_2580016 [Mycena olivaceomarginata]
MPRVQRVSFVNALAHITSMRPAVGGQMMEADYKDLPQEALQTYLSTVLSSITAVGGEPVALDLFFENGARTCDCKVFRDVDSVLVITQQFPWKECYDMLTNPTHVGPLGPLHIKVKFSHTDEAAPTEERDPGNDMAVHWAPVWQDREIQSLPLLAALLSRAIRRHMTMQWTSTQTPNITDVINEAFQLIGVSQNGVTPYTLLTEEQRMCTGPETFKDRHLYSYFKQGYLETTGTAFDRTANLLFPHPRSQPHYTQQGWGGFRGHQQYLAVVGGNNEADTRQLYEYCQDQFQELCWFPSIVTDKVYDYRVKSGQGWTSFGGLVGKARAICIAWNRKKQSLHAVTTGEPRDPVLDEEAVHKWREANPVEDEGMVDIVQQQLAPLADGLAQRAQQQLQRGRVQLPAIRYIEQSTEVIKDFQEKEESSDIEMKEEDEGSSDEGSSDGGM